MRSGRRYGAPLQAARLTRRSLSEHSRPMSHSGYGVGDEPLTALERQRLRSTVDPAALERWFVVTRGASRRASIAHFAVEVTDDDLSAVMGDTDLHPAIEDIDDTRDVDYVDEIDEVEEIDDRADIEAAIAASRKDLGPKRTLIFVPQTQWVPIVQVYPPDDPELLALWHAIEPETNAR
jgi:hypothetical protein